jgi:hypothetical protein
VAATASSDVIAPATIETAPLVTVLDGDWVLEADAEADAPVVPDVATDVSFCADVSATSVKSATRNITTDLIIIAVCIAVYFQIDCIDVTFDVGFSDFLR